jgi:DNA polymerase
MPTEKRAPTEGITGTNDPRTLQALNAIIAAAEPPLPGAERAVLGEGPEGAEIAFVGEQPGDQEDRQNRPFVGPAGQLLNRAMAEAGIVRDRVYVTNAVKHFKFEQRGKRRIHQRPTAGEVKHYRWWLFKELEFVAPRVVVALGATALLALTGKALPISRNRGEIRFGAWRGFVTVHPSYLLRVPDREARQHAYEEFVSDLKRIHSLSERDEPLVSAAS